LTPGAILLGHLARHVFIPGAVLLVHLVFVPRLAGLLRHLARSRHAAVTLVAPARKAALGVLRHLAGRGAFATVAHRRPLQAAGAAGVGGAAFLEAADRRGFFVTAAAPGLAAEAHPALAAAH